MDDGRRVRSWDGFETQARLATGSSESKKRNNINGDGDGNDEDDDKDYDDNDNDDDDDDDKEWMMGDEYGREMGSRPKPV